MEYIFILSLLQSMGISLGVGASTLAIVNFFVSISDGKIGKTERRMMGVVYVVLRIAMAIILITTALLIAPAILVGDTASLSNMIPLTIIIAVLFVNAALMTMKMMSSTFGPGLQAGSWYTAGILLAVQSYGAFSLNLTQFGWLYFIMLVLAVSLINGVMAVLKSRD